MNQDDDKEGMTMPMPASFTFSPISIDTQQQHFNFDGQQAQPVQVVPDASMNDPLVGQGRGRGKPVPSWMNAQQS